MNDPGEAAALRQRKSSDHPYREGTAAPIEIGPCQKCKRGSLGSAKYVKWYSSWLCEGISYTCNTCGYMEYITCADHAKPFTPLIYGKPDYFAKESATRVRDGA